MRTRGGLALVAAIVVTLTGCSTGGQPAGSPSAVPSATASATPTATPVSWPEPLVPTSCDALLSQETVDGVFGTPLVFGSEHPEAAGRAGLWKAAITNSGSLECVWGAMNPDGNQDPNSGDGDAWYGVAVTIVPHASAIQASISAALESTKEPARTGCDWGICFSEDVINDYWVDAEVIGTGDPANGVSESAQACSTP